MTEWQRLFRLKVESGMRNAEKRKVSDFMLGTKSNGY
jgi:hypothetical protein